MPDASVDLVLSSPPFLGLRSYLPDDDPAKASEQGSEATPGEYVDALLDVVEECRRVLTPHGSLCFELGDTYAGSGGGGGDYNDGGMREGQPRYRQGYVRNDRPNRPPQESPKAAGKPRNPGTDKRYMRGDDPPANRRHVSDGPWPLDKSLCMIPETLRWALVYGHNPHTGRSTPRWRARNVVRWCRPNPAPGALADKFRPATSDLIIACVGRSRYFDLDAVRVPFTGHEGVGTGIRKGQNGDKPEDNRPNDLPTRKNTHHGAPPLDWWEVSTEAYPGSHYATWPSKLLLRPIDAMCPRRVCTVCGKPSERLSDFTDEYKEHLGSDMFGQHHNDVMRRTSGKSRGDGKGNERITSERVTLGWTDCGHDAWRPGVVLDCYAGSGTTLAVAIGHGRDAVGIDLDVRNADLALQRVGMFLEVEHHAAVA